MLADHRILPFREPPKLVDIATFAALWTHHEITVICTRPKALEDHPDLAYRVRGALGNVVHDMPPPVAHRFDPFDRPAAFATLYGDEGKDRIRPFFLVADVVGEQVIVTLRLFGDARIWAGQLAVALVETMMGGIAIRTGGRMRVVFDPVDMLQRGRTIEDKPQRASDVSLLFRTPVSVRKVAMLKTDGASIVKSAVTRVREMAPWLGLRIDADWNALHRHCERLATSTDAMFPVSQRWNSQRRPDNPATETGMMGPLRTAGDLDPILPFLRIGEATGIGSHTAFGLGRYDLAILS
jgi:hypothetical protein